MQSNPTTPATAIHTSLGDLAPLWEKRPRIRRAKGYARLSPRHRVGFSAAAAQRACHRSAAVHADLRGGPQQQCDHGAQHVQRRSSAAARLHRCSSMARCFGICNMPCMAISCAAAPQLPPALQRLGRCTAAPHFQPMLFDTWCAWCCCCCIQQRHRQHSLCSCGPRQ